jgi:hypothetical protein
MKELGTGRWQTNRGERMGANFKLQKSPRFKVTKAFKANRKRNFTAEYAEYAESDGVGLRLG